MTEPGGTRVLAVASAGGHWQQLLMLRPAFEGCAVHYVTTLPCMAEYAGALPVTIVPDCHRRAPLGVLRSGLALRRVVRGFGPAVVISTGALPGVLALFWGRKAGARTVWIDSAANSEEMSASGRMARNLSDLWLSQWEEVARRAGADFAGAVL
jgi:hypothetical protein